MHDTGKILLGLAVFIGLLGFPFLYNTASGTAKEPPKLQSFLLVSQDKFNSFRPQLGKNTTVPLAIALGENYSV